MQATGARRRAVGGAAHQAATRWEHRRTQPHRPRSRPWTEDDEGAAAERAVPLSVPLSVGAVGAAADAIGDVVREGEEAVELPAAGFGGKQGRRGCVRRPGATGPARVLVVALLLGGRGVAGRPARHRRGREHRRTDCLAPAANAAPWPHAPQMLASFPPLVARRRTLPRRPLGSHRVDPAPAGGVPAVRGGVPDAGSRGAPAVRGGVPGAGSRGAPPRGAACTGGARPRRAPAAPSCAPASVCRTATLGPRVVLYPGLRAPDRDAGAAAPC